MKTFTRIIAVVMMIAVLATLMAACSKPSYKDQNLIGTWKQVDDTDGNWTWVFNEDGTCTLTDDSNGTTTEGTYRIEQEGLGKIYIKLANEEEDLYTYVATTKALDLANFEVSYYCQKQ